MKIAKIYLIFGIVVTLMSILLLHPNSRALAQEQFLTYENAELGISIQYPSDWYNSKSDDGSIRLQSPLQNASDMFLEQVTMIY